MPDQKKTRRQLLEEFIAKKPEDSFSRYGLALECSSTGDIAAADTHFRALNDRHPDYIPAYLMYAQMLARQASPNQRLLRGHQKRRRSRPFRNGIPPLRIVAPPSVYPDLLGEAGAFPWERRSPIGSATQITH